MINTFIHSRPSQTMYTRFFKVYTRFQTKTPLPKNFRLRDFWGVVKFGKYFLGVAWFKWEQQQSEDSWQCPQIPGACSANLSSTGKLVALSGEFLRLRNSAWDFLGVNFWSRDFLWVLLKALVFFLEGGGLIFSPIRSSLCLKIRRSHLGKKWNNSARKKKTTIRYTKSIIPPSVT